ncbi:MAG: alkyl sulfatase dimerization domain-containing protein [Acidimicrobiales bacterium]
MTTPLTSFSIDPAVEATGPNGQIAHVDHLAHSDRLREELITVAPGVWTLIGNGLSNQTFVEGPEGLIAIDTGECVEEMAAALRQVRQHTQTPVVAVIYTHFHYVAGTTAILDEGIGSADDLVIWGHAGIEGNRGRASSEIAAAYSRGIVHQFGVVLPPTGPDALVNVGLGRSFRNPDHAPYTGGFLPPTHTLAEPTSTTIAGLPVEMSPAPSDADDSITIWFPTLGVAINNLVWPALFNVFAIRGEEYRDPRVLLAGLDHLLGLGCDHLLGAHGRPISGRGDVESAITLFRDSIQFLWDQTVHRTQPRIDRQRTHRVCPSPACYDELSITREYYGVAEHHVRQIRNGLVGWFDADESHLFPMPTLERCRRLIEGFGGRTEVRSQAEAALADNDLRWALELATWLVRSRPHADGRADGGSPQERGLLATVLRTIARRTTAANIRNWCLTRKRARRHG